MTCRAWGQKTSRQILSWAAVGVVLEGGGCAHRVGFIDHAVGAVWHGLSQTVGGNQDPNKGAVFEAKMAENALGYGSFIMLKD